MLLVNLGKFLLMILKNKYVIVNIYFVEKIDIFYIILHKYLYIKHS